MKKNLMSAVNSLKTKLSVGLLPSSWQLLNIVKLSHVGKPRLCARPVSAWRTKVDPLFLEAALALKGFVLEQKISEANANATANFLAKFEEIRRKFPTRPNGPPLAADLIYANPVLWPMTPNDYAEGELCWLHWKRFRIPLQQDATEARFNVKASKRITKTITDYDDRRSNPRWKPKFKIDLEHSAIFETGLSFGLERLTEEELADCFDEVCCCGCIHSADALRKQRDRLIDDLQRAFVWQLQFAKH
jgi:hypothetical protein